MINFAAIKLLFGSAKMWAGIAAIAVVGIACWSAYNSLKESIRLEIHAAIDKKEIQFKGDVQVINNDILTLNDKDMSKLMSANTQNITSLMTKLVDLEKRVREGTLTEADRKNLASIARYQSVITSYCNGEPDVDKCLELKGVK